MSPVRRPGRWRPAFRGYQRMRIVDCGSTFEIEAELDGPIAVDFPHPREALTFLDRIIAAQMAVFA